MNSTDRLTHLTQTACRTDTRGIEALSHVAAASAASAAALSSNRPDRDRVSDHSDSK